LIPSYFSHESLLYQAAVANTILSDRAQLSKGDTIQAGQVSAIDQVPSTRQYAARTYVFPPYRNNAP